MRRAVINATALNLVMFTRHRLQIVEVQVVLVAKVSDICHEINGVLSASLRRCGWLGSEWSLRVSSFVFCLSTVRTGKRRMNMHENSWGCGPMWLHGRPTVSAISFTNPPETATIGV